jgi:hypothetical protein
MGEDSDRSEGLLTGDADGRASSRAQRKRGSKRPPDPARCSNAAGGGDGAALLGFGTARRSRRSLGPAASSRTTTWPIMARPMRLTGAHGRNWAPSRRGFAEVEELWPERSEAAGPGAVRAPLPDTRAGARAHRTRACGLRRGVLLVTPAEAGSGPLAEPARCCASAAAASLPSTGQSSWLKTPPWRTRGTNGKCCMWLTVPSKERGAIRSWLMDMGRRARSRGAQ